MHGHRQVDGVEHLVHARILDELSAPPARVWPEVVCRVLKRADHQGLAGLDAFPSDRTEVVISGPA